MKTNNFEQITSSIDKLPQSTPSMDVEISDLIDLELISKLDSIKTNGDLYKNYSEIYSGGVYALNIKNRTENPDWMSQSANSFREIFYVLQKKETKELQNILQEYLNKSLTKKEVETYKEYLNNLYNLFSDLTHHFSGVTNIDEQIYKINEGLEIKASELNYHNYLAAIKLYKEYLKLLVITAIEMHLKIDLCIKEDKKNKELVRVLTNNSYDSKIYFFSKVDENWLHWLWTKGFLVSLKKKADNPTKYAYRMPELEYLTRMAEKDPDKVAKIIDSIKISQDNFNPEVIDRFLWIINSLPVHQIKILTKKIRDERWIYLMKDFRNSGYEFENVVEKLVTNKEHKSIIEIAEALLDIKNESEISEKEKSLSTDNPFYINDLSASGIYEALADIENDYAEDALKLLTDKLTEIVKLSVQDDNGIFRYRDLLQLYDVDFFTIEIEGRRGVYGREEVKNISAAITKLIKNTIGNKCKNTDDAKRLFKYIDNLPSCRSIWRLRLFTLAQCPNVFREELKEAFFRLFDVEDYYEIEGGVEYKKALKIGFSYLSDSDQRDYITKIFEYFSKKEKSYPNQDWHKRTGWEILSCICNHLTKDEKQKCGEIFSNRCDEKYEPKPPVEISRGGFVSHKSPVNIEDYSIEEIINNLKSEWTPKKLKEQFVDDDFLSPRGVEGLGDALKEDIKKRTDEYLKNINSFFDRENIHSHYFYSLLRGIEEMLRNKQPLNSTQTDLILKLFTVVKQEGETNSFKIEEDNSWLVGWIGVHKVIVDILLHILEDREKRSSIHKSNREKIKGIISYLFTFPDPIKKHEEPGYGDLYGVAINSVRGRAFETFVVFAELDGKELANDVKDVYKQILTDDSLAVRFVIGRYLASFYFRGKEFITELLPDIFSKDSHDKKDIYLATWEGYLSSSLYDKLFEALSDYYDNAINLNPKYYTDRKYIKGLDESLAIHIALAFAHFDMGLDDPLFKQFWATANIKRHKEFISFIGRSCLTRNQAGDEWLEQNKVSKDKLIRFWDWSLKNISEPETFSGFGYWINKDKEVLADDDVIERMALTMKKSDGNIDWEYGLLKRLPVFAEKDGEKTLEIIFNYLLDSENNLNQNRRAPFIYRTEMKEALKIIYENGEQNIKQEIRDLINTLIAKGSSMFWGLKEIIESNKN